MSESTRQPLKKGYLLDKYRIEYVIGSGGFSLVYVAYHIPTQQLVVIKEYFPNSLVSRLPGGRISPTSDDAIPAFQHGLKRFFNEAIALSKLKHDNIVHVSNFFRTNGTVYMVMTYEKGRDLRWYIKRSKGKLGEKFMLTVFPQVSQGLSDLHSLGFLHLDIKPANILLRPGGRSLLLDFGAVRRMQAGQRYNGVQMLTHGFAPLEQYKEGEMGPWSDVYGLGATIFGCITGKPPPPALDRTKKDKAIKILKPYYRKYPKPLLSAIEAAMILNHRDRPQSIDEFLVQALDGADPYKVIQDNIQSVIERTSS